MACIIHSYMRFSCMKIKAVKPDRFGHNLKYNDYKNLPCIECSLAFHTNLSQCNTSIVVTVYLSGFLGQDIWLHFVILMKVKKFCPTNENF